MAESGVEHTLLVVVDHVLRELGDLVGVLALTLDALLHDGPEQGVLALLELFLDVSEPWVLLSGLGAEGARGGGELDLEGGDESLLHVYRPLGLSGGELAALNLATIGLDFDLEGGLEELLVFLGELSAALNLDGPPVLGLGAGQLLVESSVLDVLHLDLIEVLFGDLDDDLALEGHAGEGSVELGDAGENPAIVLVHKLLTGLGEEIVICTTKA